MVLTHSQITKAKARDKRYRIADGGGLVLDVNPSSRKVWRFRYQREGKDAVVTLGNFPTISLLDARQAALNLKRGTDDPALTLIRDAERKRTAPGGTFEALARAYMAREQPHWSAGHHERFHNRMTKDVFPVLGTMQPRAIQPLDITRAIAAIEGRGAQDTAVRVVGMMGQVLRYAVAKGFADRDVTADLKGGLDRPAPVRHRPAVIDPVQLGRMLADIWDWPGDSYGKPLLQLSAYLFARPGELLAMRWSDVDLDNALWSYRVGKVDVDHTVPLPTQAVEILGQLKAATGNYPFAFYSRSAKAGYVSAAIAIKLLDKIGWRERHCPHGFRATARTRIAEDLGVEPRLIEQQLSHGVSEAHGRAYNRTLFLQQRGVMMQDYADLLDGLRRAV